jgi:hypothetical protein
MGELGIMTPKRVKQDVSQSKIIRVHCDFFSIFFVSVQ